MKTDHALSLRPRFKSIFTIIPLAVGLLTFVTPWPAYAQSPLELNLTFAPELQQLQSSQVGILRISDFNITGSGSVSRLFNLLITNNGAPTEVKLDFQFKSADAAIVNATVFQLAIPSGPYPLTYRDIAQGGRLDYDEDAAKALTDVVLKTGRLPDGIYTFTVTISDLRRPNVTASDEKTLTIFNPTTLDLISPGAPVGGSECFAQFGLLPQFKWDSNADRFLVTVCEALPSNSSPEDVMQNEPRLQRLVQRGRDFFGSPSFIYPSGELPLEYGKTYYWQIQAMIDAPSGEIRLPSEIWCFQISAIGNPGAEIMLQQLLSLLSASEFDALFREGGPLHGFKPTGAAALNGRRLNLTELITFLRNRSLRIVSTQVE
jgi:hypothetical protein